MTNTSRHLDYLAGYTDEALRAKSAQTGGFGRAARYLLAELDTPERRARADGEGHTLSNLIGGRYADRVWEATQALRNMIAEGREDDEMYGERAARQDRERQQTESPVIRDPEWPGGQPAGWGSDTLSLQIPLPAADD